MSAGKLVTRLSAVRNDALDKARNLFALAEPLKSRRGQIANLLQGSRHPLVGQILDQQQGAERRLREAAHGLLESAKALASYIAGIDGGRAAVLDVSTGGSSLQRATGEAPKHHFDPAKASEIRPFAGREKTVGRLYDASGRPVGELIYSGKSGPGFGGPGLTGRWKYLEALTEHTEGHAAAVMRRDRLDAAILYLNRYPCPGPDGCFENIAAALPKGWRLTMWVVNADGSAVRIRRVGTGEAVGQ